MILDVNVIARSCGLQGDRLLAFGGERCPPGAAESTSGGDGEEETEALNEASLLDPDLQLWVPITLSGQYVGVVIGLHKSSYWISLIDVRSVCCHASARSGMLSHMRAAEAQLKLSFRGAHLGS